MDHLSLIKLLPGEGNSLPSTKHSELLEGLEMPKQEGFHQYVLKYVFFTLPQSLWSRPGQASPNVT